MGTKPLNSFCEASIPLKTKLGNTQHKKGRCISIHFDYQLKTLNKN
jgi:hypothetical protein